ncbi:purine and uridine phosphorylase [Aspergillus sclerotioniger CBS 115572]|uniref:Purine and uridine phosphorylase n=1 Tax=Aspergillus sclerotioniger CBS 115572 TaxID=1450535 RepID=A0A317WTF5_9EURO|nr:purine and uridine phosphorylase [Aspergillus sclerotioniger CBS 115572]PWY89619.1 purine and uridine phosphorylase [Aspergillus sclerotioniger CBS 115572]
MRIPPLPSDRTAFKIAIICALPLEASIIGGIFDQQYDDNAFGKAPGDTNAYSTGVIGYHNVVLVHVSNMGKVAAATAATCLRASFQEVQLALVVGICGCAPFANQPGKEMFLGDVVISEGLIEYDFGRQFPDRKFVRKNTPWENLGRPGPGIRAILAKLQTEHDRTWLHDTSSRYLDLLHQKLGDMVKYPGASNDILFKATYRHKHHVFMHCETCSDGGTDVCNLHCEDLGCDKTEQESRIRIPQSLKPTIHFGWIASGDTVMKSGEDRDEIVTRDRVVAFEMEGAGVWEAFPEVLVIKGACDYSDSHKNKRWQGYAAATAAAVTKCFLEKWSTGKSPEIS